VDGGAAGGVGVLVLASPRRRPAASRKSMGGSTRDEMLSQVTRPRNRRQPHPQTDSAGCASSDCGRMGTSGLGRPSYRFPGYPMSGGSSPPSSRAPRPHRKQNAKLAKDSPRESTESTKVAWWHQQQGGPSSALRESNSNTMSNSVCMTRSLSTGVDQDRCYPIGWLCSDS
jgi:hypothetical protein